jgi:nucleotide-binding universal stress UspA family protein
MSEAARQITVQTILVAVDTSSVGLAALQAAGDLAVELRAQLHGLFVEDIDLLRIAELPFAREIAYLSATQRSLDTADVERMLRGRAEQVRKAVASAAEQARVDWSFRVARGRLAEATLVAASEIDLVVMGHERRAPRTAIISRRTSPTSTTEPVIAVYGGTRAAQRALLLASGLARKQCCPLLVVTSSDVAGAARPLAEKIDSDLGDRSIHVTVLPNIVREGQELLTIVRRFRGKLLVLNSDARLLNRPAIEMLIDRLACPLILVR